jgi:hypothetical protein
MDDTSTITYGGDFVQTSKTASRGSGESRTEYVGGVVPQWEPAIESSEPEARRTSWTDCGRQTSRQLEQSDTSRAAGRTQP